MNRSIGMLMVLCAGCGQIWTGPEPVLTLEDAKQALLEAMEEPRKFGLVGIEPGRTDLREGRIEIASIVDDRYGIRTWRIDLNQKKFKYGFEYGWGGGADCEGEFVFRAGRWQANVTQSRSACGP